MPFTGKTTYGAGASLPELAEDVSDIIGIVSPFETPLLDHLGDAKRPATSTVHEWVEDTLLPNTDQINQTVFTPDPQNETDITVDNDDRFQVGDLVRPAGSDELTEEVLNAALRQIWEQSAGAVDTIVVGGAQKRKINSFISSSRAYDANDTRFTDLVSVYESDFGVCRVILSRWVPIDSALLLDSARIEIPPLAGRSFHFKPLAPSGDSSLGQVIGEYTMEFRNENAHGVLSALAT